MLIGHQCLLDKDKQVLVRMQESNQLLREQARWTKDQCKRLHAAKAELSRQYKEESDAQLILKEGIDNLRQKLTKEYEETTRQHLIFKELQRQVLSAEQLDRAYVHQLQSILQPCVRRMLTEGPQLGSIRACLVEALLDDLSEEDRGPCRRVVAANFLKFNATFSSQKTALAHARLQTKVSQLKTQVDTNGLTKDTVQEFKTAELHNYLWTCLDDQADPDVSIVWELLRTGANPHRGDPEGELPISRILAINGPDVDTESLIKCAAALLDSHWGFAADLIDWCGPIETIMLKVGKSKKLHAKMWMQLLKRIEQTITSGNWNGGSKQQQLSWPGVRRGIFLRVVRQLFEEQKLPAWTLQMLLSLVKDPWYVVQLVINSPTDCSQLLDSYIDEDVIDVETSAEDGSTPLALAVEERNIPVVRVLLKRGAKVSRAVANVQIVRMRGSPQLVAHPVCDASHMEVSGRYFHCPDGQIVTCPSLRVTSGKWYYELLVVDQTNPSLGWVDDRFMTNDKAGNGVGGNLHSWGVDGDLGRSRHGEHCASWRCWGTNQTIGCALDIDEKKMRFAVEGEWDEAATFDGFEFEGGLHLAFSGLITGACHLQREDFAFEPPDDSFLPLAEASRFKWEEVEELLCSHTFDGPQAYSTLLAEARSVFDSSSTSQRGGSQHSFFKGILLRSQARGTQGVWDQFEKGPYLGCGVSGEVFRGKDRASMKTVAIKVMNNSDREREEFWKLRSLSHPNILRVFDCVVEAGKLFLITDLAEGGVLSDYLAAKDKCIREEHVVGLMEQVIRAAAYCHQRGFVHNDLKPENVFILRKEGLPEAKATNLLNTGESGMEVRIPSKMAVESIPHVVVGDLGHMTYIQVRHSDPTKARCGDPRYIAPEAYRDACTSTKSDVYSLGVMLFELLSSGCLPYFNRPLASWQALDELPATEREAWCSWLCSPDPPPQFIEMLKNVSDSATELCRTMLSKTPAQRPTAIDCLKHPFFNRQREGASNTISAVAIIASRLAQHARRSFIQNALANALVARLDSSLLAEARQLFLFLDKNGKGCISCEELFATVGQHFDRHEKTLETIFSAVGIHGQDTFGFNEFAAAVLDWSLIDPCAFRAELRKVFTALDKDEDGRITLADFRRAFPCCSAREEKDLSEEPSWSIMEHHGAFWSFMEPEDLERFVMNALGV